MSNFQEWCAKVLPLIQAAANGEDVQASCDNGNFWVDLSTASLSDPAMAFDFNDYDYRIKPRTVMIGDVEVPEPMREAIDYGVTYYLPDIFSERMYSYNSWNDSKYDCECLLRGVIHKTRDGAIAHAKALIALTTKKSASHE